MRATRAEAAARLPGDDLVDANVVMDRATTLPGTAEDVWPWLVQLGKGRAGWYLPRRAERLVALPSPTPPAHYEASTSDLTHSR